MASARPFLLLLLLLLHLLHTSATSWKSTELPNPQDDPAGLCGRGGLHSSVCDPDGLLSLSDADTIDGFINFIHDGTHGYTKLTCAHSDLAGAQLAVAVVEKMDCGLCLGSKENRAFEFAKDLHDRWGVGDVKCQNGVVLFLSLRDHVMGLSVGRGVKHVLRTDMVPLIMGIMKPKLRKGEYGQAIVDGVHAIGNIVSGMEVQPVEENSSGSIFLPMFFGAGFLALIARNARRNQKFKRCKEALENIDKDRACAENNQFIVTSCPICLNDFKQSRDEDNEDTEEEEAQPLVEIDTNGPKSTNVGSSEHNVKSVSAGNGLRTANAGTGTMEQDVTSEGEDAVKILPCGHKFHERCILQWFSTPQQTNSQCPICRQSVLEPETVEARTNNGQPSGWDVYEPEYNFRMRRAQHYYSDFITLDMMNDWNSRRRDQTPMTTSPELTRLDPAAVTEARRSGADGSSFAFGGGSSAGGGGGGSSW